MNYKNMANKILVLVFSLFLLSIWLRYTYKDTAAANLFYTVMEAALVGGIADWFAITAIFGKPLGFPWHTALIPRHRDRIIREISNIIEEDLLSIKSIRKRVAEICFVEIMIDWMDYKGGKKLLKSILGAHSRDMIARVDPLIVAEYLESYIKDKIKNVKITPLFKSFAKWGLQQEKDKYLIIFIVDELIHRVERPDTKLAIYKYMESMKQARNRSFVEKAVIWLGEQTNSVNVSDAADALYQELVQLLQDMKNPDHILHKWIHEKLVELVNQPDHEIPWADEVEHWKAVVVERINLTEIVVKFTENCIEKISTSGYSYLLNFIYSQADQHWEHFKQDHEMQNWLEVRMKQATFELIEKEHYLIGTIVQEVLHSFTDEDLNGFIEEKAGDDLQWIRINGCIVGAVVGFILFIFLHYVYPITNPL